MFAHFYSRRDGSGDCYEGEIITNMPVGCRIAASSVPLPDTDVASPLRCGLISMISCRSHERTPNEMHRKEILVDLASGDVRSSTN